MEDLKITDHAYKRAKKRMSWRADVLDKMASKAICLGITHSKSKGNLKRYFTKIYLQYRKANNIRVYGENIFIFNNNTLITIFRLPQSLIKLSKINNN